MKKPNNWSKVRYGLHVPSVRAAGKRLLAWIMERNMDKRELADLLGVVPSATTRWFTGERSPRPAIRAKIEKLTGIPAREWMTAAEIRWAQSARKSR